MGFIGLGFRVSGLGFRVEGFLSIFAGEEADACWTDENEQTHNRTPAKR